jgi:hypothetical protein
MNNIVWDKSTKSIEVKKKLSFYLKKHEQVLGPNNPNHEVGSKWLDLEEHFVMLPHHEEFMTSSS